MMFVLAFALLADPAVATPPAPPVERCGYRIVQSYPHDATSFTQGLFWDEGHLYEATGQYGQSRIARLDLQTGKALAQTRLPSDQFGEGITRWENQIIGVTWQGGVGNRWSIKDLKRVGSFKYEGEGWGLTMVAGSLVLSDGTTALRFFDPATMKEQKRVTVRFGGRPIAMINELETIDGQIWANIWMTDFIVRIDPATGNVVSLVDMSGLKADAGARGTDSVLNGIAWDAQKKRLFVTGKNWPKLYEIALAGCR